jgi:hypothetical protein
MYSDTSYTVDLIKLLWIYIQLRRDLFGTSMLDVGTSGAGVVLRSKRECIYHYIGIACSDRHGNYTRQAECNGAQFSHSLGHNKVFVAPSLWFVHG